MQGKVEVCAEVGSNHSGDCDVAVRHIEAAARCGAHSVKFQLFRAETLDSRPEVQQRLRPYEVPLEWLPELATVAREHKVKFGVTPFAVDLVEPLRGLVDFVKVSAYDLPFLPLIEAAAGLGVPVVLSTAMATWNEMWDGYMAALNGGAPKVTLLHGVAAYPAQLLDMHLSALTAMRETYPHVGLSDHTPGFDAAVMATVLGASMIEKHFRLCTVPETSPDYPHSLNEEQFAHLVVLVRRAAHVLGTGVKDGPLECERELFETCRRSATKPLRGY